MLRKTRVLKAALVAAGYSQQINQALRAWLTAEGYTGQLNEAHRAWLSTEGGYTGHYSWQMRQWEEAGFPLTFGGGVPEDILDSSGADILDSSSGVIGGSA